jgi:hypothetical protein
MIATSVFEFVMTPVERSNAGPLGNSERVEVNPGRTTPLKAVHTVDYDVLKHLCFTFAPKKMDGSTALSIYREEKARALQERRISHAQLMTEAKEAFAKMLADAQLARKGGRPRNNPNAPSAAAAAAQAKAQVVVAAPAKKAAPPAKASPVKTLKAKPAPKKASGAKKPRVVAKRAHPVRVKLASSTRKSAKKTAPARAKKPAARSKSAKKR